MCAIIDADVVHEAFGNKVTDAGREFRAWIDRGDSTLVVGGDLLKELDHDTRFRAWRVAAAKFGRLRRLPDNSVQAKTAQLQQAGACESNDHHVIALAQLSGARLLFSNDAVLHRDFRNRSLVKPQGRVYSTLRTASFAPSHRRLLRTTVCTT